MITPEMPDLEDLRYHEIRHMSVMDILRFSMWREGGVWDSARALDFLRKLGRTPNAKYPLNVAGNMLARLVQEGSASRVVNQETGSARGYYTGNREVLADILRRGLRAAR
jgi:hypothetical protein